MFVGLCKKKGGVWKSGAWKNGTWKNGIWQRGNILSKKFKTYIPSRFDPPMFYRSEEKSNTLKELTEKVK